MMYVPPHMRTAYVVQQQGGQQHFNVAPQQYSYEPSQQNNQHYQQVPHYQQFPAHQLQQQSNVHHQVHQQVPQVHAPPGGFQVLHNNNNPRQGFGQAQANGNGHQHFGQAQEQHNPFHQQRAHHHHHHSHHHGGHSGNNQSQGSGFQPSYHRPRFNQAQDEAEVRTLFETTGVTKGINFSQYEDIPVTCSPAGCVKPIQTFKELHLPKALEDNIKLCGYDNPTPVQKYTIPIALAEMDIMACAQTGSGKTASFLLPVICKLLRSPETEAAPMFGATYPKCIVMAPTRELAIQIHVEARKFTYLTGLRAVVLYGGADIRAQLNSLNVGGDIIVATPGRLWDVYQRNRIRFQSVRVVILDEADRMLDMGFEPQIRQIVQSRESDMPARDQRQTLMFSATFPREIQNLAQEFLSRNVAHLTVGRIGSTTGSIIQTVGWVEEQDKIASLCEVISSSNETDLTLVFVETKRSVEDVTRKLIRHGYHAVCIHGDKAQNEREAALHMFKSGQRPILIATDVASRGLDIPNVTCVVQYDLPHSIDDYVHRIGRTGRVGNEGEGISFFNAKNMPLARDLITTLSETEQVVPDFLYDAVDTAAYAHQQKQWSRRGGGGRGRGRGGGNRGGYDSGFGGGGGFGGHHQPHHHQQQGVYGGHQQHNNYFSY